MPPKPHVLIVDDEPGIRCALTMRLRSVGCEVDSVSLGEEALASAKQSTPDLILLDVNLPDRDGFEICRSLQRNFRLPQTRVVLMSANFPSDAAIRGQRAGAVAMLPKPIKTAALKEALKEHLNSPRRPTDVN